MNKINAGLAIQVLPKTIDDTTESVIEIVDKVIEYLKSTGLNVFVGPFETTIEGDFDELMQIASTCQKMCIEQGAIGVNTYIKVFYNPTDGVLTTDEKVTKHHK